MRSIRTRAMAMIVMTTALAMSTQAAAADSCLQPDDMRALLSIALPDAIEGMTARCRPVLPAGAFLPSEGAALAARYRREAPVDTKRARRAIEIASGEDLSFFASDETVTRLAHDYVGKTVRRQLPLEDCDTIDNLVALAAPMRGDAVTEALMLGLQLAGPGAVPGLPMCARETAAR